jgi:hypothetical protein
MSMHKKERFMRNFGEHFSSNFSRAAFHDLLTAGTVSGTALLVEHLALWQEPLRLKPPASYVVGTATLGTALTWWTLRQQCPQAAVAFWGIAGMGGAVVTTAYWLRHVVRQLDDRAFQAGTVAAPRWAPYRLDEE